MIDTKNLIWFDDKNDIDDKNIKPLLTAKGSLTAILKQQYADFKVELLTEQKGSINDNEVVIFNDCAGEFYIREVLLYGDGKVRVFARSIIPDNKVLAKLLGLGNKPLGEVLFSNKNINRGLVQYTKTVNNIWGRRSVFHLLNNKILVCEFFISNDIYINRDD